MASVVPGWESTEWKGGRVKFVLMLAGGLLACIVGFVMAFGSDGEDRVPGVGVLAFGIALASAAPAFRTWARRGEVAGEAVARAGSVEAAIVFPYSRTKALALAVGATAFALASAAIAFGAEAFADDPADSTWLYRVVGAVGTVVFGAMAALWIRSLRRRPSVSITRSGIQIDAGGNRTFVPWEIVADVRAFEIGAHTGGGRATEPLIGIDVSARERVEAPAWARLLMPLNRRFGGDISIAVRTLDVDPSLLYWTLRRYFADPPARAAIGTSESIEMAQTSRGPT
jgi:hypothetical protein